MGLGGVAIVILPSIMCLKLTFSDGLRGGSCPSCTNRAKFSHSRFCEFSVFCGRTLRCLVGALETRAPPWRVAWVWQDAIPS